MLPCAPLIALPTNLWRRKHWLDVGLLVSARVCGAPPARSLSLLPAANITKAPDSDTCCAGALEESPAWRDSTEVQLDSEEITPARFQLCLGSRTVNPPAAASLRLLLPDYVRSTHLFSSSPLMSFAYSAGELAPLLPPPRARAQSPPRSLHSLALNILLLLLLLSPQSSFPTSCLARRSSRPHHTWRARKAHRVQRQKGEGESRRVPTSLVPFALNNAIRARLLWRLKSAICYLLSEI